MSGSSPATVVAIGSILMPAMVKAGFPKSFGAGVITTSGALGILIPPSIVMVMYSVATNTSVGALFMAGVVPGILLGLIESIGSGYIGTLTGGLLGSHYSDIFAFIVLIIVLTLRPSGLLGERVADRA